jgi:PAS domain S-box-containing protein
MATILVLDDDPSARDLMVTILGYAGHDVREAADGTEALRQAQAEPPHLIVADLLMPTMDGFEFVRQLREIPALARTPVVFYTATYLESEARNLARACGVIHVIAKPAEPQEILDVVNRNLGVPSTPLAPPLPPEEFRQKHLGVLLAKLAQKTESMGPRLDAMIELSLQLASERDPQRLLSSFCGASRKIIGAKYAVVGVLDRRDRSLRYSFASGMDPETATRVGALKQSVPDGILSECQPRRLHALSGDPQRVGLPPDHPPVHSYLCAPIASPDRVYGWLCLANKIGAGEFNDEDEGLAQILAAQVGRIYENSSLYAEVRSYVEKLQQEAAERRRAEQQLLLQAAALETAANAIVITDRTGAIQWVNPAFSALTGYSAEEVIGRNPRLLKSGAHDQAFYKMLWGTILRGQTWRGEFTNRRKDGSLYHDEHTITPVRSRDGQITHFVAIMQDVTERKGAEEEIRKLNTELEQRVAQRTAELESANKELEAFCYSVSHDLRAPARAIRGITQILLEEHSRDIPEALQGYLHRVHEAGLRMGQLIEDLLGLSSVSRQELRLSTVNLTSVAQQILDELKQSAPQRQVDCELAPGLVAEGDPNLIRIALDNLLRNAWKFTQKRRVACIHVGVAHQNDEAIYFVRDNGAGFDMTYVDKLFIPFQRLHSAKDFDGTGIGLAIVQRVILRHGGRIWAEGREEEGATFHFTLPAGVPRPPAGRRPETDSSSPRGKMDNQ